MPRTTSARFLPLPADGPGSLPRDALLAQLDNTAARRLVLLAAPAGYGKTTLARQYQARHRAHRHFIWLTLDEADNDVRRLFKRIESALVAAFDDGDSGRHYSGLDRIEALIAAAGPLSLVLDEFEHLHDEPALRATRELIARLPDECELVVASRHVPNIGVDRLRLQGEMIHIGVDELRFSLPEVAALLRGEHGLPLTEAQLSTVHRRSEGSVVALQLFALSCHGRTLPANLLESFTGSARQLAASFVAELLERLTPELRDFLIDSCVLGEFSADLCDAVLGREDSRARIDLLQRQGVFLDRRDGAGEVWCYHTLFSGIVRDHAGPERRAAIHRRAAEWFTQAGQPAHAIEHRLASGDSAEAIALMAGQARGLLADGRIRMLQRWFEQVPASAIRQCDELRAVQAWVLALSRRFVEANMLIEPMLADPQSPHYHEARTIHSLCLWMADRMNDCFAQASLAVAGVAPGASLLGGILANILAHCHLAANRFDAARQALSRALLSGVGRRNGDFAQIIADTNEAMIDLIQGRLGSALMRLRNLASGPEGSHRLSVRRGILAAETMLAHALYERGDLATAERVLMDVMPYAVEHGTPDLIIDTYLLAARLANARADGERALACLDELEREGNATGLSRLVASAGIGRSWLAWQSGQMHAAQHALGRASSPSLWADAGAYVPHVTDFDSIELMRLRLAIERNPADALLTLPQEIAAATTLGRQRRALTLRALHALALACAARPEEALIATGEALQIASREGHVRAFLDEGETLRELVREWFAKHPQAPGGNADPLMAALRETLLRQLGPVAGDAPEPLSPREQDVLRVLAEGLRNHEIGERLALSETTVRTHLRSINQKLRANSRTDAVAIARRHGLVD